ncbi:MAG: prephenate dehydrogenase [Clostridia bacterium]|nr:prephenate dehydrogenase [Clostridia bacterium]
MQTSSFPFTTVGIAGLGLIGATLAKAVRINTGCIVFADDIDDSVLYRAEDDGLISGRLVNERIGECDLFLLALYPEDAVSWLRQHAPAIRKGAVVVDCCGVKRWVMGPMNELAAEYGFVYAGGHPMTGREFSGYAASDAHLCDGAYMILADPPEACIEPLEAFFKALGFKGIQLTTAKEHDRIIAYTSQLAHLLASAYILSPTSTEHLGFSAGGFRSMTRVAYLNEKMWTELFLENADYLADEIGGLRERLAAFEKSIRDKDADALRALLKEGRERKETLEGWNRDDT